jgi:hypothetical protein
MTALGLGLRFDLVDNTCLRASASVGGQGQGGTDLQIFRLAIARRTLRSHLIRHGGGGIRGDTDTPISGTIEPFFFSDVM